MPRIGTVAKSDLDRIIASLREKIYLPSPLPFYATLGSVVGTHFNSHQPVWLMQVGPPGCGKSLMLSLVSQVTDAATGHLVMHELGNPTGLAAFVTSRRQTKTNKKPTKGHADTSTGGLLTKIGEFGIIKSKDFTTILQKQPELKAEIISVLREVYDGEWSRPSGLDGGESLSWGPGKVGFIGCVTNAIDRYYSVISELGDRWLYWRWPRDEDSQRLATMYSMTNEKGFADSYMIAVNNFLHKQGLARDMDRSGLIADHDLDRIYDMAMLLSLCRVNVSRDPYKKEDYGIPQIEAPNRAASGLANIYAGMIWCGVSEPDAWKVLYRILIDSIPAVRSRIISIMLSHGRAMYASEIAREVPCGIPTVTYALEDLALAGVVQDALTPGNGNKGARYHALSHKSLKVLNRVTRFIAAREEDYEKIDIDWSDE